MKIYQIPLFIIKPCPFPFKVEIVPCVILINFFMIYLKKPVIFHFKATFSYGRFKLNIQRIKELWCNNNILLTLITIRAEIWEQFNSGELILNAC